MKTIERHPIDQELAKERYESAQHSLNAFFSRGIRTVDDLDSLLSAARRAAAYGSVVDPRSSEITRSLALGAKAAAGIALASPNSSGEVEVDFDADHHARVKAAGPNEFCHAGNWRFGFYLSVISKDNASADALCKLPVEIIRQSRTKSDECIYRYVDVLQRFWRHDPEISPRLVAAVEATAPEAVRIASPDYILNIVVPEMELFYRFLLSEVARFNDALLFALERHKKFWSKGDRKKDSEGYLALGMLAICALAGRSGMPFEVQSDYIPSFLMQA
jgi:hypothetical protein